ncbi:E3 ubiquitin-protein ligase RNF167 [Microcaecilia unicolor]|uniref:RING-type E3 ubiquitin transferase n=1 Tax=Microcaecilia unicolor TaxID=1415580 RepID=A0A6P7WI77_9AMPH|nr:E3 ubiquitin-protein ligase RNF167 [Microcaecilia unicolor]XP_030043002.1 E3 ubiquitin-protein ligase RNF167 [Microcaecilia unicolor]XP_030043003.1 E3 ubiquitin-protein ligase RNF167 [Microcaecilia unicolor]XP_030043005.1 E3 ubiquitin-protein ligase RNF167 [Microcaecilia unicolor]XP_030043006.1 E3 ubiquitin-protein ligase RNF167 [Microcaecilia unicolor]XP_030043007.1 E3 ubiquitin-protein ligase RNF167 [Microcaecilia unicolor]
MKRIWIFVKTAMTMQYLPLQTCNVVTLLAFIWAGPTAEAFIYAYSNFSLVFDDLPAVFGASLPRDGLKGCLVEANPQNACAPIEGPPPASGNESFFALIRRYECSFDVKVLHAQQAGYQAVIVHNVNSDSLLRMMWSNETIKQKIQIPAVFVGESTAKCLAANFTYYKGAHVILVPESNSLLGYYLIPFTGVVGIIIVVMCTILIARCVQHRKRRRRNRLSKDQLKKVPIHKFKKGDEYDVCAICLDEYEEGDQLRILPCSHAYHCKCVDPWLTQTKKTCPVCKQRVIRTAEDSDSDTESQRGPEEEERNEQDSERTPLLRSSPSTMTPSFGSMAESPAHPEEEEGLSEEEGEGEEQVHDSRRLLIPGAGIVKA